jgi:hypothetical protein
MDARNAGERKEREMGEGQDEGENFTAHGSLFTDFGSMIATSSNQRRVELLEMKDLSSDELSQD